LLPSLLPGISNEVSNAKRATLWSDYPSFVTVEPAGEIVAEGSPYLYICSYSEVKKQTVIKTARVAGQRGRSPKNITPSPQSSRPLTPKTPPPKEILPTIDRPSVVHLKDENGDDWSLGCVCNIKTGEGLLVGCEKCGNWQHAICMGLNSHTIPEKYLCDKCSGKTIRCQCGNNLSFRFAIIKCSMCGYYVHKRCEGIGNGMMPKGDFVCHFCGRSNFRYDKPSISDNILVPDTSVTFSSPRIEQLPSQLTSGPFSEFVGNDLLDNTISARDFCEMIYDRFRPFFFVSHPQYISNASKKKRRRLFYSFMNAIQYMCNTFYSIEEKQFFSIFDNLLYNEIFETHNFIPKAIETLTDFTESARIEIPRMSDILRLASIPKPVVLKQTNDGIVCNSDLVVNQFLFLADGLIGDKEEFDFTGKVDSSYYQISDTRFVLDSSMASRCYLHKFKRSIKGNCSLKLFQVEDGLHCGVFVSKNHLGPLEEDEEDDTIPAGTPLALGFDFIPAVIEDIIKWISWRYMDQKESLYSNPNKERYEREESKSKENFQKVSTIRKKAKEEIKKRPGRRGMAKSQQVFSTEITLFSLISSDSPGEFLFRIKDEDEDGISQDQNSEVVFAPSKEWIKKAPESSRNESSISNKIKDKKSLVNIKKHSVSSPSQNKFTIVSETETNIINFGIQNVSKTNKAETDQQLDPNTHMSCSGSSVQDPVIVEEIPNESEISFIDELLTAKIILQGESHQFKPIEMKDALQEMKQLLGL